MSELISGKEAWIAKSDGNHIEYCLHGLDWSELTSAEFMAWDTSRFLGQTQYKFRLKPRTITLNGIEVPAPFEPKCMESFYVIDGTHSQGWINGNPANPALSMGNPKWRTKEEIVQVVAALRAVFKCNQN